MICFECKQLVFKSNFSIDDIPIDRYTQTFFPMNLPIKVTFAINSILKLSHKKLSSSKLEKTQNFESDS